MTDVKILTYSSSASAGDECRGQVLISGSYGGEYNAWHAAKWGIRGVVLNDAGVGRDNAGINGLPYLDRIGLPGATADAQTCHIADAEHMLGNGIISHVNDTAAKLGCAPGQTVKECAERMRSAPVVTETPPAISGGRRYTILERPGEPKVICLDAAPMLEESDAGSIAVTGSHAAMFRGKPDGLIAPAVRAVFFSDAGVGLDGAGVRRLAHLDERNLVAGAAAASSAPIGNSRAIYEDGILSHVNRSAAAAGASVGMKIRDFIDVLLQGARSGR